MISPDELNRYFQQRMEQNSFSGVVLITQGNSQLFAGAYGYASRSWKVPNTFTMRFDSASVTKLFTSVYLPKDRAQSYPLLMERTPYSVGPYGIDQYRPQLALMRTDKVVVDLNKQALCNAVDKVMAAAIVSAEATRTRF